jgi:flagellin-specific chaperone FliS
MRELLTNTVGQFISKGLRIDQEKVLGEKMSQTLFDLYNSMLKTLVNRRKELIEEIEDINQQIVEIKNEAKENGVTLSI